MSSAVRPEGRGLSHTNASEHRSSAASHPTGEALEDVGVWGSPLQGVAVVCSWLALPTTAQNDSGLQMAQGSPGHPPVFPSLSWLQGLLPLSLKAVRTGHGLTVPGGACGTRAMASSTLQGQILGCTQGLCAHAAG